MSEADLPQVRVRDDQQAVALYSPPWRVFDSGDGRNAPVRVHGIEHEQQIDTLALTPTLNPAQRRELAGWHEAGHAVAYSVLKVPVVRVELDGHRARGHTRPWGEAEQPFPYWVAGHLAGLAAGELWLEQENLATPANRMLCDVQSANDHAGLFAFPAPCKLVLSYGSRAGGPVPVDEGVALVEVEIETMIKAARFLLHDAWDAVSILAAHLLANGTAGPGDLAKLPQGRLSLDEIHAVLDAGMRGSSEEIPAVGGRWG